MSSLSHVATVSRLRSEPKETEALQIGIMGTPVCSGNRGVSALRAALARLCLEAGSRTEVILFGSNPNDLPVVMRPIGKNLPIRMVHWRMSPKGGLRHQLFVIVAGSILYRLLPLKWVRSSLARAIPWIGALEKTKLVGDVRGGDSFSDIYGLKRFLIATLPVATVIWVKGSIGLFPQTYGPFRSGVARGIARWITRHASFVIARDKASHTIAQQLAGPDKKVVLSPDVAFALHVDPIVRVELDGGEPTALPLNSVGLNVNGLMFNGGYTGKNMFGLKLDYRKFLTDLAIRLLNEQSGSLLLVAHTYEPIGDLESDNHACTLLKASLPAELQDRVRIVTGEYDAHQLKGIIGCCHFFIGARMHSCIAALSQGIPCVGVAYSMKFRGVFESVGVADWVVDGRSMDNETAVAATMDLYRRREEIRTDLGRSAVAARERLRAVFSSVLQHSPN